jgi:carboxypeptidase C (cathepsin A)
MRTILGLIATAALFASHASAADEPIVTTRHAIVLAGKPLAYTADAGRLALKDETGAVRGALFFVAYRVPSKTPRPVTFVWNGGPGGNSILLHTEVVGPRRVTEAGFVDNADTLLATSDLVFLDPQSTGYSRAATEADAKGFYSTVSDQVWTARFIDAWRARFDAKDRPFFLLGESFGVPRANGAALILAREKAPLKGIVLISGGKIAVEQSLPAALDVALHTPNKAMGALAQGKLQGPSPEAVEKATEDWARAVYAPALAKLDSLSPAERETLAQDLAAHLGVPADKIDRKTLVMTARSFVSTVAAPKKLDPYDLRRIAGAAEDKARKAMLKSYLTDELGYRTDLGYWGVDPGQPPVNASWTYGGGAAAHQQATDGGGPPEDTPWISQALAADPKLKIFVGIGLYDSQNSCEANAELHRRMPPAEAAAIATHCYVGGHMMYKDEATRVQLNRDVTAFIKSATSR